MLGSNRLADLALGEANAGANRVIISKPSSITTVNWRSSCSSWRGPFEGQASGIMACEVLFLAKLKQLGVVLGISNQNAAHEFGAIF